MSLQEEAVMEGKIVFGVNPYREICTLHLAGNMLIDKDAVLRYAHAAARHAKGGNIHIRHPQCRGPMKNARILTSMGQSA